MSISDAITDLIEAKVDLKKAQDGCEGTWGYHLADLYDKVDQCEKDVDDSIAMLIQEELGDILAKIKAGMPSAYAGYV